MQNCIRKVVVPFLKAVDHHFEVLLGRLYPHKPNVPLMLHLQCFALVKMGVYEVYVRHVHQQQSFDRFKVFSQDYSAVSGQRPNFGIICIVFCGLN